LAISPPSDIVLDVARAADPSAVEAARTQLLRKSHPQQGVAFDVQPRPANDVQPQHLTRIASAASPQDASRKFEAMVLQTFIGAMMPKNAEGTYGKGIAGDMWKSLMAEKVAEVVAERGGIGIAERVLGDFHISGDKKLAVEGVNADALDQAAKPAAVATALVDQIQRQLADELSSGAEADGAGLFKK
jgi:peptidoglycan hydrolase FlgJ